MALLANISVEYYTRLERGNGRGVSDEVLESVGRALQLDEAEHAHLLDLIRASSHERRARRASTAQLVRPSVRRIVDAMTDIPAFVHNGRLDLLYLNNLAAALYSLHLDDPVRPPSAARFVFLDPRARSFYIERDTVAHDLVAALRGRGGPQPVRPGSRRPRGAAIGAK